MAYFTPKTWKDRLVEFAGRRTLKNVSTNESVTYDVTRAEGQVSQEGDAFSPANMNGLEQRIADGFSAAEAANNQLSSEIIALNDEGAIKGLEVREGDGVYITYQDGADTVSKKLGSNPYLLGSEYTENWGFSVVTNNRSPSAITEYISTTNPIDITHIQTITARLGIVNNGNTVCYCGMGISKTRPTSFATAKANEIKEEFSSGMTGDISHLFELDVSEYSGEYYPFIYTNFPYETGIHFWKAE